MDIDRHGLEILDREACMQLLATAPLGRVAITSGGLPTVLPVNFKVQGDQVLFRTTRGTKLDAATENAVVAFEVDEMDPVSHAGWSVVVTGVAREVVDPGELEAIDPTTIARWPHDQDGRVVSISTAMVSGRRLGAAPWPQGTTRTPG
jgi:uncharacterized protein